MENYTAIAFTWTSDYWYTKKLAEEPQFKGSILNSKLLYGIRNERHLS